jgi:SAM-dependent methyltransferase
MGTILSNIDTSIHPQDEMFFGESKDSGLARAAYFKEGAEINATIQQLIDCKFGDRKKDIKFLDFACGYGRSTRFLVHNLPPDNVWVSDIYSGAVKFQTDNFGVHGFDSCHDPGYLVCDVRFDMIFVGSLFTHLPERRFGPWLQRLFEMLSPDGILAFSVHDEALAGGQVIPTPGILFVEASESRTLSKSEYGVSYVTEDFVRNTIHKVAGSAWPYKRLVKALCGAHDIYLLDRNPAESFTSFDYRQPPVGYVERFELSKSGSLSVAGWAGDPNAGINLEAVRVSIGGVTITSLKPERPRPDVAKVLGNEKYANSGWECDCPIDDVTMNADEIIEVAAVSETGLSTILHISPLSAGAAPATPDPHVVSCATPQDDADVPPGDRDIAASLAVAESNLKSLKAMLNEVKASRDDLRRERDDWKEQAQRLALALAAPIAAPSPAAAGTRSEPASKPTPATSAEPS